MGKCHSPLAKAGKTKSVHPVYPKTDIQPKKPSSRCRRKTQWKRKKQNNVHLNRVKNFSQGLSSLNLISLFQIMSSSNTDTGNKENKILTITGDFLIKTGDSESSTEQNFQHIFVVVFSPSIQVLLTSRFGQDSPLFLLKDGFQFFILWPKKLGKNQKI